MSEDRITTVPQEPPPEGFTFAGWADPYGERIALYVHSGDASHFWQMVERGEVKVATPPRLRFERPGPTG